MRSLLGDPRAVSVLFVVAGLSGIALGWLLRGAPQPALESAPAQGGAGPAGEWVEAPSASEAVEAPALPKVVRGSLHASIQGAVFQPGAYTLAAGARVYDLIQAAGGVRVQGVTHHLNLAAHLVEGSTVTVAHRDATEAEIAAGNLPGYLRAMWTPSIEVAAPAAGTAPLNAPGAGAAAPSAALSEPGKFPLSTVTGAQLESIPGIGPSLAKQILESRDQGALRTLADLEAVPGIGPKRRATLEEYLTAP